MRNEQTQDEDARVEAFLTPLVKVSPAARPARTAPSPPRVRKLALAALAVLAVGAGVAVAATTSNDAKQVTVIEQNGETSQGVLCQVPVGPNGEIPEHLSGGQTQIQPGDPCPTAAPSSAGAQSHQLNQSKGQAHRVEQAAPQH